MMQAEASEAVYRPPARENSVESPPRDRRQSLVGNSAPVPQEEQINTNSSSSNSQTSVPQQYQNP